MFPTHILFVFGGVSVCWPPPPRVLPLVLHLDTGDARPGLVRGSEAAVTNEVFETTVQVCQLTGALVALAMDRSRGRGRLQVSRGSTNGAG